MLQRMRELAVQAASDTVTTSQKAYLNDEFGALRTEINRIGNNTMWNDTKLLNGTAAPTGTANTYKFQVGSTSTTIDVTIPTALSTGGTGTAIYDDINTSTIATAAGADAAIASVDLSLTESNKARSKIGAAINQLTYAADNLSNISMNTAASRSRIEDTDYAQASTELARTQIIQQAATAMLAQANQSPQSVLALLK
jgi:flagellin